VISESISMGIWGSHRGIHMRLGAAVMSWELAETG
jgi:hypothetical protein